MEVAIEGILETLLVGAITSLCLISPFFLVFGHIFRLGALQNLFVFLLYERDEKVTRVGTLEVGESFKAFALLLLVAALFGLGVLAESFSKMESLDLRSYLIERSDKSIRLDSLEDVSRSYIASQGASKRFAQFASDFIACRDLSREGLDEAKDNKLCRYIIASASGFYYTAKNYVYKEETRFSELNRLQSRIDFTRAISMSFGFLAVVWFFAFILAFFAELKRDFIKVKRVGLLHALLRHWLSLSAIRCLVTGLAFLMVAFAVMFAWSDQEEYYDKRVFGYYLSSVVGDKDGEKDASGENIYPATPFIRFKMPGELEHFEPSSIVFTGKGVIVSNDKSSANPLIYYPLSLDQRIDQDKGVIIKFPNSLNFGKIESLHYQGNNEEGILLAAGNFDRRYLNSSLIFKFNLKFINDVPLVYKSESINISEDPCKAIKSDICIIEGMASRNINQEIILGVRYKVSNQDNMPLFTLLKLKNYSANDWHPELWKNYSLPSSFKQHGISSLDIAKNGDLFILTSVERKTSSRATKTNQVMGALWTINSDSLDQINYESAIPKFRFSMPHKPEGIAQLDRDGFMIVFDDDAARKGMRTIPNTFAIEHNESVYAVFGIDD